MIPRNFGNGPGSTNVNLRISKTWSFGSEGGGANANQQNRQDGRRDGGQRNTVMGGAMAGGRGPRWSRWRRPWRFWWTGRRWFRWRRGGDGRYNLTFSLNFQNLLNHTNFANPVGNLGSRLFGQSTATAGFGGFGVGNPAYNRRIDAQIRFSF